MAMIEEIFINFTDKGVEKLLQQINKIQRRINTLKRMQLNTGNNYSKSIETKKLDIADIRTKIQDLRITKRNEDLKNNIREAAIKNRMALESNIQKNTAKYQKFQEDKVKLAEKAKAKAIQEALTKSRNLDRSLMSSGLSFLFTGMAVKRVMDGIGQSATSTYNKINAGTDLANNASSRLAVGLEMIQYAIGEGINRVIEQLAPILMPLIERVVNFIENNNWIIWAGFFISILATLGMIIGQVELFWLGLKNCREAALAVKAAIVWMYTTGWTKVVEGITSAWSWIKKIIIVTKEWIALKLTEAYEALISPLGKIITKSIGALAIWLLIIGLMSGQEPAVKLVSAIVTAFATILAVAMNVFNTIFRYWINMWDKLKNGKLTLRDLIDPTKMFTNTVDAWKTEWQKWKPAIKNVGEFFEGGLMKMTDAVGTTNGQWNNTIADLVENMKYGISEISKVGEIQATTTNTAILAQNGILLDSNATLDEIATTIKYNNELQQKKNETVGKLIIESNSDMFAGLGFTTPVTTQ